METINFYPKFINEIDDQDNPAKGDQECLLITGHVASSGAYFIAAEVYHIKPDTIEPADSIALFWKLANAQEYCDFFCAKSG